MRAELVRRPQFRRVLPAGVDDLDAAAVRRKLGELQRHLGLHVGPTRRRPRERERLRRLETRDPAGDLVHLEHEANAAADPRLQLRDVRPPRDERRRLGQQREDVAAKRGRGCRTAHPVLAGC